MKIDVAVATANDRIFGLEHLLMSLRGGSCLVVHQFFDSCADRHDEWEMSRLLSLYPGEIGNNRLAYLKMKGRGLARSRNAAAAWCQGDILVPTDDDVVFLDGAYDSITSAFEKYPEADIITFKILTPDGRDYKNYPVSGYRHTRLSIASVSSVEIAIRGSSLRRLGLRWDEQFGLGARYGGCLEIAFLSNALRRGAVARYVPAPIVVHPADSSGSVFNQRTAFIRGALFGQMFGWMGFGLCFYQAVKHRPRYRAQGIGMGETVRWLVKGWADYCWNNKQVSEPNGAA